MLLSVSYSFIVLLTKRIYHTLLLIKDDNKCLCAYHTEADFPQTRWCLVKRIKEITRLHH